MGEVDLRALDAHPDRPPRVGAPAHPAADDLLVAVEEAELRDVRIGELLHQVVLVVDGDGGEGRKGAGELELGQQLAAVAPGAHQHRHLGGDELLLLLPPRPRLHGEAVEVAVEAQGVAAVELPALGLALPPDVLGQHLGGPGRLGAVAQVGAEAGADGGGEVVGLRPLGGDQAAHVGDVAQGRPGGDVNGPQPVARLEQLAGELLLARLRPRRGPPGRRILEELGSSAPRHQAQSRQAEDKSYRGSAA